MKLYRVTYGLTDYKTNNDLSCIEWVGTQAEAKAIFKKQMDGSGYDIQTETVEVPTDKPGLLAWLNQNMCGDRE